MGSKKEAEEVETNESEVEPSDDAKVLAEVIYNGFAQLIEQSGLPTEEQVWVGAATAALPLFVRESLIEEREKGYAMARSVALADDLVVEYKKRFIADGEPEAPVEPRKKPTSKLLAEEDDEEVAPIVLPTSKKGS